MSRACRLMPSSLKTRLAAFRPPPLLHYLRPLLRDFGLQAAVLNVCFWLKADLRMGCDLRPLYPRKQTYSATPSNVCF